jgi:hypothetical protein
VIKTKDPPDDPAQIRDPRAYMVLAYQRVRIESKFGKLTAFVTDGHLPYPYGREMTGYEVSNLAETLTKAKAAGVDVLIPPYKSDERDAVVVRFPGGYIAEIHSVTRK